MPLPLILLGVAVVAGGTGIVSGGIGAKKIHDAKDIIKGAEHDYETKKALLDRAEKKTKEALDRLGKQKLDVWKSFKRFADAFEKIKNKPSFTANRSEKYSFTKHELGEIEKISITALSILGSSMLTAGAGALAGIAAYGGTMALGVASTGTAISTLSGAAAVKATLAALGGGALSAGGGGIALGTTILTGAVAGPILAVAGVLLNAKGNSSLRKAEEVREAVDRAIVLMNESKRYLNRLQKISSELSDELLNVHSLYEQQVSLLEDLVARESSYNRFTREEMQLLDNTIMLVKLLKQITQVDLIAKVDGKDVVQTVAVTNEINNARQAREQLAA